MPNQENPPNMNNQNNQRNAFNNQPQRNANQSPSEKDNNHNNRPKPKKIVKLGFSGQPAKPSKKRYNSGKRNFR